MKYADPLTVDCPACKGIGSYRTRDLIALRARCQHCSASLETVGREMRTQIGDVKAFVATLNMAIKLGVYDTIPDADFESIERPADFGRFLRASGQHPNVDDTLLSALTQLRGAAAEMSDLNRTFKDLFPFVEKA